jgi:hypothetical protein
VHRQLQREGGADAEALAAVASSPALGAPADQGGDGRRRSSKADVSDAESTPPSALGALGSAAVSDDGGAGGWLIVGLALLTVALAGTALARRRSLTR